MAAAVQVLWEVREAVYEEPADPPKLSRKQRDRIGERLRQMYEAFQDEPLSPTLQEALERLTQNHPA